MKLNTSAGLPSQIKSFSAMFEIVKTYGAKYNPANPNLSVVKLDGFLDAARTCHANLTKAEADYAEATSLRTRHFEDLPKLAARILLVMTVAEMDATLIEDVRLAVNQMKRSTKKKEAPDETKNEQESKSRARNINPEKKLSAFLKILELLEGNATYIPNEEDLSYTALKAHYDTLNALNNNYEKVVANLKAERLNRDFVLYNPETGLNHLGKLMKTYAKSIYGIKSDQFKLISGFKFRTAK